MKVEVLKWISDTGRLQGPRYTLVTTQSQYSNLTNYNQKIISKRIVLSLKTVAHYSGV